jgi:glycosyltransferase involved in cell wall biosynthesis
MHREPAISVFMPVHDAAAYLDESVASILGQSDPDFEFVIVDDASTDGSRAILRRWARADRRIRLIESDARMGNCVAPNLAVGESRALLCARMDADDVAHPDRLRQQRQVLSADPSVALVGAMGVGIDRHGRALRPRDRWRLVRQDGVPPFIHATIMFRRALFLDVGGYRAECAIWEDVDLCRRLAERGRVMVLPAALYRYRFHGASTTLRSSGMDLSDVIERMHDQLAAAKPDERSGRSGPRAETLYYVGGSRLWAGVAPAYTGRLRDLPWRPPTVAGFKLLLLATWGRWSPGSLRAVLRGATGLRDRLAALFLAGDAPVEWRCE